MRYLAIAAVFMVTGCYHPQPVSVFGRSGTAYTAPTICGALVQCLNSKETSCFYDRSLVQTGTAVESTDECKEVKK
jgi:hypothetical protein